MAQAPYGFARSKSAYRGADSGRVRDQLEQVRSWSKLWGPGEFAEKFFWILRKNPEPGESSISQYTEHWNKRLIPFKHNAIQRHIHERLANRNIFLKPRQGGYTTWMIIMRLLLPAILEPGVGCLLISQNNTYATAHFSMLHRAYRWFGFQDPFNIQSPSNWWAMDIHRHLLHVTYSSRRELIFDALDSRIVCASAEVEEVGQGLTIQHLGCTEVARWEHNPEETLANVKEAVPIDGTIDLESTANMMGGYFYEECMRARNGNSEYTFHFHPWYFHEEYTLPDKPVKPETLTGEEKALIKGAKVVYNVDLDMGRIAWRRFKKLSLRHNFAEKYPEDEISCFLLQGNNYFDNEILIARKREVEGEIPLARFKFFTQFKKPVPHKRYVIGVDPASGRDAATGNLDWCGAIVLEVETGEQVASYHARKPPEDVAVDMAQLGRLYNNALVAVERTGDGGTVMLMMQVANQYTNIYKHREWWKRDWGARFSNKSKSTVSTAQKLKDLEGFPTSVKTRPVALNRVAIYIRESPELIHDLTFINECLTFVRDETGKPAAAEGSHDDMVSAMWIANYVRLVVLGYLELLAVPVTYKDEAEEEVDSGEVEEEPVQ
jgi:hypothetical protein